MIEYKINIQSINREIKKAKMKRIARTFFSFIIVFAYLSLNTGFAMGLVLCTRSNGHVSLKFNACESCCSPDLNIAADLDNEDSCGPCSDIPVSSYISQFCSRVTKDLDASREFQANAADFFSALETADRDLRSFEKIAYMNQICSILKSTILLN